MFFLNFHWFYFKKGNHVCLKENAVPIWHFFSTVLKCLGAELSFSMGAELSCFRSNCPTAKSPHIYQNRPHINQNRPNITKNDDSYYYYYQGFIYHSSWQILLLLVLTTKKLQYRYLAGKQQYQFYSLWFTRSELKPTIYRTWGEHVNHYTNISIQTPQWYKKY